MTSNLFTDLPSSLPDELFTALLEANNLRIERIVSHGPKAFGTTKRNTNGLLYYKEPHDCRLKVNPKSCLQDRPIQTDAVSVADRVHPIC
jgi:hypothetical protein